MADTQFFSQSVSGVTIRKGASDYQITVTHKDGITETVDFSSMDKAGRQKAYGSFIRQSRQYYKNRKSQSDRPNRPRQRKRR